MSGLQFNTKLVESNSVIAQKIAYALIPQINQYLDGIYDKLKTMIPPILISNIQAQSEYTSIMSGSLKGEFGIPDPQQRLSEILSTISNGSIVTKKPTSVINGKISGGIKLQMIKSDFSDLISLGAASVTTEKGTKLNWLQWLLLEGDTVIISDYAFVPGPSPASRTGLGVMKQFNGAFWRVPPEFAGSIKNNWITRAIDSASSDINSTIQQIIK